MAAIEVGVAVLAHGEGLELPAYATRGAAGMDVRAAVTEPLRVGPGELVMVPTGLVVAVPEGHELQVRPRSGLAAKHRIGVLNSPGTIDSDYRGEVKIILMNLGREEFVVERGDRIAQLVLARHDVVEWRPAGGPGELPSSDRGEGGFGHTGRG